MPCAAENRRDDARDHREGVPGAEGGEVQRDRIESRITARPEPAQDDQIGLQPRRPSHDQREDQVQEKRNPGDPERSTGTTARRLHDGASGCMKHSLNRRRPLRPGGVW